MGFFDDPNTLALANATGMAAQMAAPSRIPINNAQALGNIMNAYVQGGTQQYQDLIGKQLQNYNAGNQALMQQNALKSFGMPTFGNVPGIGAAQQANQPQDNQQSPTAGGQFNLNSLSPLTAAQIKVESNGDAGAVSPKGAQGLMQLMPETAKNPGFGIQPAADSSPQENLRVGSQYMQALQQKYGDTGVALAAYNWGPQNVDMWLKSTGGDFSKLPQETQKYVNDVVNQLPDGATPTQQPQQQPAQNTMAGSSLIRNNMYANALGMNVPAGYMYDFQHGGLVPMPGGPNDPNTQAKIEGAKESAKQQAQIQAAAPQKAAESIGADVGENLKTSNILTSNMPMVLKQFQDMRDAARNASYGLGINEAGEGIKPDLASQFDPGTNQANVILKQRAHQGVLQELGPMLAQAGVRPNKFLEGIANDAVGLDMSASPQAKQQLIDGLEWKYVQNLKSVNQKLRNLGQSAMSDEQIDKAYQQMKSGLGVSASAPSNTNQPPSNSAQPSQAELVAEAQRRGLIK